MTKPSKRSIYRGLAAGLPLLFAGLVMAPILSATGDRSPATPKAEATTPAASVAAAATTGGIDKLKPVPYRQAHGSSVGDYAGDEYAGVSTGGGAVHGGQPGQGHYTFAANELGGAAIPMLSPRDYSHYGSSGGRGGKGSTGGGQSQPGNGAPGTDGGNTGGNGDGDQGGGGQQPPDIIDVPTTPGGEIPGYEPDVPDDEVVTVPEPSSWMLLAFGVAGLIVARRRAS
jgi:hypothetical protein